MTERDIQPIETEEPTLTDLSSLAMALNADLALADQKFYEERDYEEALTLYQKVSEEETDEELVTRALYWIGETYIKLEQVDEAISAFEDLAKHFPGHHLGESAKRRIASLQS